MIYSGNARALYRLATDGEKARRRGRRATSRRAAASWSRPTAAPSSCSISAASSSRCNNRCPHRGGSLCDGMLTGLVQSAEPGRIPATSRRGEIIRCPWHSWEFDIRTGQSWCDPDKAAGAAITRSRWRRARKLVEGPYMAETFPVSVENDYVVVEA